FGQRRWRDLDRTRTRSNDHATGFNHFFGAIGRSDFNLLVGQHFAVAFQQGHTVAFEQAGNAAGQVLNDAVFARDHGRNVHADASRNVDAVNFETFGGFMEFEGAVEQGLGRNAAHVQAGAAQRNFAVTTLVAFDTGGFETQLGCLDRSHVAARAGTDYY